jgi:hypothetical protein
MCASTMSNVTYGIHVLLLYRKNLVSNHFEHVIVLITCSKWLETICICTGLQIMKNHGLSIMLII